MKSNTASFSYQAHRLIIPSIWTIIFTVLCWKINYLNLSYAAFFCALFLLIKNTRLVQKEILVALLIFNPLTTIQIKRHIALFNQYPEYKNIPVNTTGTIISVRPSFDKNISTLCTVKLEKITHKNKTTQLPKNIHLFLPFRTRIYEQQKIKLKNISIKSPTQKTYQQFCMQNNIWGVVHTRRENYTLEKKHYNKTSNFFSSITKKFSLKTKILFDLIFLGKKEKGYISQKIQHQSLYWGVSHIIARSGLHLSIIFLLLFCILTSLPIPHQQKIIINLIFIGFFFISTPHSTSFNRAFLMIVAYLLSQIHQVMPNSSHLLLVLALLTLLYNPFVGLSLGFQLSFGITYIIIKALSTKSNQKYCFKK